MRQIKREDEEKLKAEISDDKKEKAKKNVKRRRTRRNKM